MIKLWLLMTGNDLGDLDTFAQQVLDSREQLQYRICSKHFSPRCYIWTGKDLVLKPDAVPTIFGKKSNGLDMKDNANFSPSNKGQVAGSLQQHGGKETNALELHESMEIPDINEGVVDAETSKPKPGMKNASTSTCRMMVDNSTNTEPSAGKADKGVQWPEYEFNFNGERWKILHDHYYPYHLNAATPTKKSALDGSNLIKSESFSQPIPK
ncbi:uncharacterized protein WCC33_016046, partial [Rhinophrynus dorsalis]